MDFLKFVSEGKIDVLSYGETEPARIVNRETFIVPQESAGRLCMSSDIQDK